MPRVLLVAPRSDLPGVDVEIEDVLTSGLEVDPLLGDVRSQDVTRRLRKGGYDALLVAGHGDAAGVRLSGETLRRETLTAAARAGRLDLVYLNTCESEEIGCAIASETAADCICWIGPADDQQAGQVMALWAAEFARTGDARAAYQAARPCGSTKFLYLSGNRGNRGNQAMSGQDDVQRVAALLDRMERSLSAQIREVGQRVGKVEEKVGQLDQRLHDVDAKVDMKTDALLALLPPSSPWRMVAWFVGFFFLLLPPAGYFWLHESMPTLRDGLVWAVLAAQLVCVPFFLYGSGKVREKQVHL